MGVKDLDTNMIADEDLKTRNGFVLLPKGQKLTYPVLARIRNYAANVGIAEPIAVLAGEDLTESEAA